MKKALTALILSAALAGGAPAYAQDPQPVTEFTDVNQHWAEEAIYDLAAADILHGSFDEKGAPVARPDESITRAEFVQLAVNAVGTDILDQVYQTDVQFKDVAAGDWYYPAIHLTASIGFVEGVGDGKFEPNRVILRGEMAKILYGIFTVPAHDAPPAVFTDVPDGYWAKPFIDQLSAANMVHGFEDGSFKPQQTATRAEAVMMIYNVLHEMGKRILPFKPDDRIPAVVLDRETKMGEAFLAMDFGKLHEWTDRYETGMEKFKSNYELGALESMIGQGYTIRVTPLSDPKLEVVDESFLRAVVLLSGVKQEISFKHEDAELKEVTDLSGYVYLMRTGPEAEWKVYRTMLLKTTE